MKVFVTTQMRSGSTWLCDLLATLLNNSWAFLERGDKIKPQRFRQIVNRNHSKVYKMHWTHPNTICSVIPKGNKQNFVISITRDVKDIAISMIMYLRYDPVVSTSPRLSSIYQARKDFKSQNLNDKDYINLFIKTHPYFKGIVDSWKSYNDGYTHPNYKLINYEDLIKRPMITFKSITDFLGINIGAQKIKNILGKNSFQVKTSRRPGRGDNTAFRRIGIVGDHKNYLNQESLDIIEKMLENEN